MNIGPQDIAEAEQIWPRCAPLIGIGMLLLYPKNESDRTPPIPHVVFEKTIAETYTKPLLNCALYHYYSKKKSWCAVFCLTGFTVTNLEKVYMNSNGSKSHWIYSCKGFFQLSQPSSIERAELILEDFYKTHIAVLRGTATKSKCGEIKKLNIKSISQIFIKKIHHK
jgi:hypothetical protein